jgi:2'-5' RNA ligase
VRLFLAINLPDELRNAVGRDIASLVASSPGVSWVHPDLLHVTVRFLGERDTNAVDAIGRVGRRVAATARRFDSVLAGIGAFPNFARPRVVWLGMRNGNPMIELAQRLDDALLEIGEPRPDRPFRPHLTLGRVKRELPVLDLEALERNARAFRGERPFRVDHVHLMKSELSPRGPAYSVVAALPLETS